MPPLSQPRGRRRAAVFSRRSPDLAAPRMPRKVHAMTHAKAVARRKPVSAIKAARTELIRRLRSAERMEACVVDHTPSLAKLAAERIARLRAAIDTATEALKKRGLEPKLRRGSQRRAIKLWGGSDGEAGSPLFLAPTTTERSGSAHASGATTQSKWSCRCAFKLPILADAACRLAASQRTEAGPILGKPEAASRPSRPPTAFAVLVSSRRST